MSSNNGNRYKPYTTPYTGTGSVKTEEGWVSLRDLGAPGAASGPGNRRVSCPPVASFHHIELTTTNVTPPLDQTNHKEHSSRDSKRTGDLGSRPYPPIITELISKGSKGIEGHGGGDFDLPRDHLDLSRMSSRDIALKIALLHLTKGNIHEEMQQAVTNPDFLTRQPRDQFRFREDMARRLREIVQAIRAWEEIGDKRAENLFSPSLVDMLMITHDHQPASPAVARTENEKEENGEDGAGV